MRHFLPRFTSCLLLDWFRVGARGEYVSACSTAQEWICRVGTRILIDLNERMVQSCFYNWITTRNSLASWFSYNKRIKRLGCVFPSSRLKALKHGIFKWNMPLDLFKFRLHFPLIPQFRYGSVILCFPKAARDGKRRQETAQGGTKPHEAAQSGKGQDRMESSQQKKTKNLGGFIF